MRTLLLASLGIVMALSASQAFAAGGFRSWHGAGGGMAHQGWHRSWGGNGAASGGAVRGWRGRDGAGGFTARRYQADGQGNAQGGYVHGYRRANGNSGYRSAQWQKNADGSASRDSQAYRQTQAGTLDRQSSLSKDSSGNLSYQRDTTLTGKNGTTVNGSVSRDNGEVTRSVTCSGPNCPQGNP